ncbi:MAG: NepR family anti-sigma factor [Alphaproteobacteria bacterium]
MHFEALPNGRDGPRRGIDRLSERKLGKPRGPEGKTGKSPSSKTSKKKQRAPEIGRALRSVYDETLREEVPSDFRDLLSKLS